MRRTVICVFTALLLCAHGAACEANDRVKQDQGEVVFGFRFNGKDYDRAARSLLFRDNVARIVSTGARGSSSKESRFIDYNDRVTLQCLTLEGGQTFAVSTPLSQYEKPHLAEETQDILGYRCRKATVRIRSNTYELWFTDDLPIKGSPSLSVAPEVGLVLKMVRNGNMETYAKAIDFRTIGDNEFGYNPNSAQQVDKPTYERKLIESRFQTITIFDEAHINFEPDLESPACDQQSILYRCSKGTIVCKKVKLPELDAAHTVIAELTTHSNGDAYDRTGSLFVIPTDRKISFLDAFREGLGVLPVYADKQDRKYQGVVATEDFQPPIELMRFITPFGVGFHNERVQIEGYDWADEALYRLDVSEFLPRLQGEVWIGAFIGNYDKGGHILSLRLKYYPGGRTETPRKFWIEPIFNTVNIMEMSGQSYATMFDDDRLTVTVDIPQGLKNLQLRYLSTGHGGWGGGDEFNPKLNELFVDDRKVYEFIPWRNDCATYRLLNPASGNFGNGLSSSDLSRSNWCPGAVTIPETIPLRDVKPGRHTFEVAIPIGAREGSSFSSWNVSGCLIGEYE